MPPPPHIMLFRSGLSKEPREHRNEHLTTCEGRRVPQELQVQNEWNWEAKYKYVREGRDEKIFSVIGSKWEAVGGRK